MQSRTGKNTGNNLRESGRLRQMNAILIVGWAWESRQDIHVGDLGLAEHGLKLEHDGAIPPVVPIGLLPNHWWHNQNLQIAKLS